MYIILLAGPSYRLLLKNLILKRRLSSSEYLGAIMKLCIDKRGILKNQVYLPATGWR